MMNITLRPWTVADTEFSLSVRNCPALMRWFRQNDPIELEDQKAFIKNDTKYNGRIIELNGIPVGLCGVKNTGEFSIAVLPDYQNRGVATEALKQLLAGRKNVWSDVFIDNPALGLYKNIGFKIEATKPKYCIKKDVGPVDAVLIRYE